MSGINDIKNAFAKAAPGIDLRAVRMRYEGDEQVLEFDICRADGAKQTVVERLPNTARMTALLDAAMKVAKALGASVSIAQDNTPVAQDSNPIAQQAAQGLAKLVGEPVVTPNGGEIVIDMPYDRPAEMKVSEIEHQGEKYELVHDGHPQTLFF